VRNVAEVPPAAGTGTDPVATASTDVPSTVGSVNGVELPELPPVQPATVTAASASARGKADQTPMNRPRTH
jgi:hypothetical protein